MATAILAGSSLSPLPQKIEPKNDAIAIGTAKLTITDAAIAEEQLQVLADHRQEGGQCHQSLRLLPVSVRNTVSSERARRPAPRRRSRTAGRSACRRRSRGRGP